MEFQNTTERYGMIFAGLCDAALELAFAGEWIKLKRGRAEVLRDFADASEKDSLSAAEYKRRIGSSNLQSYADVMIVRARQGWKE